MKLLIYLLFLEKIINPIRIEINNILKLSFLLNL